MKGNCYVVFSFLLLLVAVAAAFLTGLSGSNVEHQLSGLVKGAEGVFWLVTVLILGLAAMIFTSLFGGGPVDD